MKKPTKEKIFSLILGYEEVYLPHGFCNFRNSHFFSYLVLDCIGGYIILFGRVWSVLYIMQLENSHNILDFNFELKLRRKLCGGLGGLGFRVYGTS